MSLAERRRGSVAASAVESDPERFDPNQDQHGGRDADRTIRGRRPDDFFAYKGQER